MMNRDVVVIDKKVALKRERAERIRRSKFLQTARVYSKDRLAVIGAIIIFIVAAAAIFAPMITPYNPNIGDGTKRLLPIGTPGHILGLDEEGRDILSRLIYGGRLSLASAVFPIVIMFFISLGLGLIAGYFAKVGEVIMRVLDVLFAFPTALLAIAISAIIGTGLTTIMLSVCIVMLPYMTRVVYTSTLNEKNKEYVEAAKALGANKLEILFKEICPNVMTDLIVYSTTLMGTTIVFAAGLSFIGLGIQPPQADWGRMVTGGISVLTEGAPHIATIPGLVILIVATAFNWIGDGLQSALDPFKRTQL
ncbi:ABC transporter permease [Pullulanibacillus sp. KACC 23026]|uniref:ABC transporter permease n=1 Tax=Pullulanibacillus sp. KACC 23026 TaxID=3028315 RepID=UPI0023AF4475|nr:ABC transporter permease [Pullulanibacillus sp. KACC 23026]WEG11027.1 ABC transporter permease [Pullulanibacillus sp. KACC 23026]